MSFLTIHQTPLNLVVSFLQNIIQIILINKVRSQVGSVFSTKLIRDMLIFKHLIKNFSINLKHPYKLFKSNLWSIWYWSTLKNAFPYIHIATLNKHQLNLILYLFISFFSFSTSIKCRITRCMLLIWKQCL